MALSKANTVDAGAIRELVKTTFGIPASDGDGVRLVRIIGTSEIDMIDPFLLFDVFGSDEPDDYVGGFPDHPHRGFETVTYLLAGRVRHKDSAGHEGVIESGGVQWMTAGRGIVHSEMPEQEEGLLKGVQLWINLPAVDKMVVPGYQEFPATAIPVETHETGGTIKVIAGGTDQGTVGPLRKATVAPLFLDVSLGKQSMFRQYLPHTHSGFLYVTDGTVRVGIEKQELPKGSLGVLGPGDRIKVVSGDTGSRFLLVGGRRLNEPVARGGPFVMNTREEVLQAFQDYQTDRF